MNIKELREASGMTRTEFAKYFGIKYRTVQSWEVSCESNARPCPTYLLDLMKYKLEKENIIKQTAEE
jgi:DNA-binding transcriptional regulator YiaG